MDDKLHAFKLNMFYEFVLLNFVVSTVHTYVTLDFQPKIISINQNINITCTVKGIDKINSKLTRQWSKGPDLICYNGHPIDSTKYKEILTAGNQFKLQIKNVSELDVDCKYQCRYGFQAHAKIIQSSKDNFEYPPANEVRAIVHSNESDPLLTVKLHFKKIFPMPRCTVLIEGSSRSFNVTSSKSFGNYYEVILRHQSIDKLRCTEEVVVKCKLLKEYSIPTEDRRKCSLKGIHTENPSKQIQVIILSTCIPLLLLILLILFLIMSLRKRKEKEGEISESRKMKHLASMCSIKNSKHNNYSDKNSYQAESCLCIEEDTEIDSSKNKQFTENQKKNLQYQEESSNMILQNRMSVTRSFEEMTDGLIVHR